MRPGCGTGFTRRSVSNRDVVSIAGSCTDGPHVHITVNLFVESVSISTWHNLLGRSGYLIAAPGERGRQNTLSHHVGVSFQLSAIHVIYAYF